MKFVKKTKYLILGIIILVSLLLLIAIDLFLPIKLFSSPKEIFIVGKQYSQSDIVNKLWTNHFIRNKTFFSFLLKDKDAKIQPGAYFISQSMTPQKILRILSNSPSEIWVTIPEGLRKEQTLSLLQQKFNWKPEEKQYFLKTSQEGHLFPETYLFDKHSSPQTVIQKLNNQLQKEYILLSGNIHVENKIITIASLVQREAESEHDMRLISGIIQNRLKASMPLSIDATLQYVIGTPDNWWPTITNKSKTIDSPFNTYKYKGLPPSPICNPGEEAINAALHPDKNSYFYWLYDARGNIHCAQSYKQHLDNIRKYLSSK